MDGKGVPLVDNSGKWAGLWQRPLPGCLLLAALGLGIYGQVSGHEFVLLDDLAYITENPLVRDGLTWEAVRSVFMGVFFDNWIPVTGISHMIDVTFFGLEPGPHQLMNAGLHVLTAIVLLLALRAMTGAAGASLLVAALFVVHPLRVESVAWAAERKDVLAGLFWALTLLAYAHYARTPSLLRYAAVLLCFALGLMSKPMVVTLPFVLLLLDRWPLARWQSGWPPARLLLEKLPMLPLVAGCAYITLRVQEAEGAMNISHVLPFLDRMLNAPVAYLFYVWKTTWPTHLAVFYPHPAIVSPEASLLPAVLAVLVLGAVTVVAWIQRIPRPHLLTGWLWFLGTAVPVIGLVQVGGQGMADRYAYLPTIGLYLMLGWSVPALRPTWILPALAGVWIAALAVASYIQVGTWRDSESLFEHATRATEHNYLAHNNLGNVYFKRGEVNEAIAQYEASVASWPDYEFGNLNLALRLIERGDTERAKPHLVRVLTLNPAQARARLSAGLLAARAKDYDVALQHLHAATRLEPDSFEAHFNLAGVYLALGRPAPAAQSLERALQIRPDDPDARSFLSQARSASPALP